jgi:G:T/U-mismatch repair DNA glycosylase
MPNFDNYTVCNHPFDEFLPPNLKTLIIGTFPTHERNYSKTFRFYYAGEGNLFWPTIEQVYSKTFLYRQGPKAKSEREDFLKSKGLGITDMLEKCYRKNDRSQDQHIFPITFRNIFSIIEKNQSIEAIILTSRTKIIGALGLFETYCHHHNIDPPELLRASDNVLEGWFTYADRDIEILVPYSTSRTVIEGESATPMELIKMYKRCLT